jgi:hypothetical protein
MDHQLYSTILSVCRSVCLSVGLWARRSVCLSVHRSIGPSVCRPVGLSAVQYICLMGVGKPAPLLRRLLFSKWGSIVSYTGAGFALFQQLVPGIS